MYEIRYSRHELGRPIILLVAFSKILLSTKLVKA